MDPKSTIAIVVGIEKYAAGDDWDLPGPANDAFLFTEWLIKSGLVPSENIFSFISPLGKMSFRDGVYQELATRNNVDEFIRTTLPKRKEESLIFYWGGHGAISEKRRRLFYADATTVDKKNLDLDNLSEALKTRYFPNLTLQILLVDACATFVDRMGWQNKVPTDHFPEDSDGADLGREQYTLLATGPGEDADNIDGEKTGLFSRELMKILAVNSSLPPDWEKVRDDLRTRFKELHRDGQTNQRPASCWFKDKRDKDWFTSPGVRVPRDSLSDAANIWLPYLVDRKDQNKELRVKINEHRKSGSNSPLICFFHGERGQCVREYQYCLKDEFLSELLEPPIDTIRFMNVFFSRIACRDEEEFRIELAQGIYKLLLNAASESQSVEVLQKDISEKIQNDKPGHLLVFASFLHDKDFSEYPENVYSFLDFWNGVKVDSPHPCLVLVFVQYGLVQKGRRFEFIRDFFRRSISGKRKIPDLNDPSSLPGAHVIKKLDSVEEKAVDDWIDDYGARIENYWKPAGTLRNDLLSKFPKETDKLSMSEFVTVTKGLLKIAHTPGPS
jgi:hypothetical protein